MDRYTKKKGTLMVKNKIIPAGSICHIIQRAPGKEVLFLEEGDYLYFLKILKNVSSKHNVDIFCFVLMHNHFHLLCRFIEDNASKAIKNLCERYAWFFNTKYKRKGHVFYGVFRAGVCLDNSYLLTSSLYIHANPAKAGLVSKAVSYRWSSCSLYTEKFSSKTFIKYKFILSVLDGNMQKSRRIYKELFLKSLDVSVDNALNNVNFLKELRRKFVFLFSQSNNSFMKSDVLDETCLENKLRELSKFKRLRKPQDRKARLYLIQQMISGGYSLEEISKRTNLAKRTLYDIISAD